MPVTQSFESSVEQLRTCLTKFGCSSNVRWVFNEDVAIYKGRYWIRAPLPSLNGELAKKQYNIGIQRGLGIKLSCLCRLEATSLLGACSACFIFVPDDDEHSECSLLSPESLQFTGPAMEPSPMSRPGLTTTNGLVWLYLRWRSIRWVDMVPSRAAVESVQTQI